MNFDLKGLQKQSIYNKCRFDIELPSSRPTTTSITADHGPYNISFHSTLRDGIHELKIEQRQGVSTYQNIHHAKM